VVESFAERRRAARVTVRGVRSERTVAISVRLVDISLNGVLMLSPRPVETGQYAHLSARLGKHPLEADIQVRRVSAVQEAGGGYKIGARLVSLDEVTRGTMRQLLASRRK
jgi:hypothetical protein